jgi:hypothetical protein
MIISIHTDQINLDYAQVPALLATWQVLRLKLPTCATRRHDENRPPKLEGLFIFIRALTLIPGSCIHPSHIEVVVSVTLPRNVNSAVVDAE